MSERIVLVGCSGAKLLTPAPARELYQGVLFQKARAYAERHGARWAILSARYGLVEPTTRLAPYDVTLAGLSRDARLAWTLQVAEQLAPWRDRELVVLAGALYCGWTRVFPHVVRPLAGLGIGEQLAWLSREVRA